MKLKQKKYSIKKLINKTGYFCFYWEGELSDMALYYLENGKATLILADQPLWPNVISQEDLQECSWGLTYAIECTNLVELKAMYL